MRVSSQQIVDYLMEQGVSHNHAQGVAANIVGESSNNPGAVGDSGTSFGLIQWHGPRGQSMINAVGPDWASDWQGQLDYLLDEPDAAGYFKTNYSSPQQASVAFTVDVERPANAEKRAQERLAYFGNTPANYNAGLPQRRAPTMANPNLLGAAQSQPLLGDPNAQGVLGVPIRQLNPLFIAAAAAGQPNTSPMVNLARGLAAGQMAQRDADLSSLQLQGQLAEMRNKMSGGFTGTGMQSQAFQVVSRIRQKQARGEPLTAQDQYWLDAATRVLTQPKTIVTPEGTTVMPGLGVPGGVMPTTAGTTTAAEAQAGSPESQTIRKPLSQEAQRSTAQLISLENLTRQLAQDESAAMEMPVVQQWFSKAARDVAGDYGKLVMPEAWKDMMASQDAWVTQYTPIISGAASSDVEREAIRQAFTYQPGEGEHIARRKAQNRLIIAKALQTVSDPAEVDRMLASMGVRLGAALDESAAAPDPGQAVAPAKPAPQPKERRVPVPGMPGVFEIITE